VWEYRPGSLGPGFDAAPAGNYTIAQAQALCASLLTCTAFSFDSPSPTPTGAVPVSFKYETFWAPASGSGVYVLNRGYLPNAANLWVADITDLGLGVVEGLRVNGERMIRARYPNARTVEQLGAMQILANSWTQQPLPPVANYTFNPPTPFRGTAADNFFQTFKLGVGGPCASRFTPQAR